MAVCETYRFVKSALGLLAAVGNFFPEIIREIADDFYKRRICSMTFGWFDVVEIPEDQRWLISNLVYQMFNGLLPEMHDGCLLTGTLLPHARSCECVKYACATHQDYLCALKLGQQEASPYFRKDDAEANIINESGPLCWVFEKGQFTARGRGAIIQLRCPHQPHMGTQPSHFQPVAARTSSRSRSPPARPSGARPPDKCGIGPIIELTKLLQDHEEYVHTYLKKHKTDLQTLETGGATTQTSTTLHGSALPHMQKLSLVSLLRCIFPSESV